MAQQVFSASSPITTGSFLYSNSGLTTPVANGRYSDGTTVFIVTGGAGEVTSTALCSASTAGVCYDITNNEAVDISIQYYDGNGTLSCQLVNAGGNAIICIQSGQESNYTVSLGTGCSGSPATLFTIVATGGTCGIDNVCTP